MNAKYWNDRAKQILLDREKETEKYIKKIEEIYRITQSEINKEITKIFNKYAIDGKLTKKEAIELLNTKESKEYYEKLLIKIQQVTDKDVKRELLSKYNALAYNYRISRLEALKNDIYVKCKVLANKELEYTSTHYTNTFNNSYKDYQVLISENLAKQNISLSNINSTVLKNVLNAYWLGSNYSKRIWKNAELLTRALNSTLSAGILSGQSIQKMAKKLDETMNVGMYNSTRLIRTETNYFHNQAELQSYKDDGIIAYKYLAVLDNRTSEICRELNGKIFRVKDAVVGENYPPMHPFCRSTSVPITEDETDIEFSQGNNKNRKK